MTFNIFQQVQNLNSQRKQQRLKRIVIKTVRMTRQTVIPAVKKSFSLPPAELNAFPRRVWEICSLKAILGKAAKRVFL